MRLKYWEDSYRAAFLKREQRRRASETKLNDSKYGNLESQKTLKKVSTSTQTPAINKDLGGRISLKVKTAEQELRQYKASD